MNEPLTKASLFCKLSVWSCFFGRSIEALTARLGAVGLASPTLVGEGLSDKNMIPTK